MNRHRLLVVPVVVALALGLTACIPLPLPLPGPDPTPSPTVDVVDPGRVDEHAAEQLMREALPVVPAGYDVYDEAGLDGETLGGDWTDIDHDAQRVARVVRGAESPGWDDFSLGPGFYLDVEIVLMSSADAAGLAYNDVASAASQPYSYDSDDGSLRTDYAPLAEPSGRWPFGTVEQSREQIWSSIRMGGLLPRGSVHRGGGRLGGAGQRLGRGARGLRGLGRAAARRGRRRAARAAGDDRVTRAVGPCATVGSAESRVTHRSRAVARRARRRC
jgi:hypothetical protein